jgi:DNA-binding MarR family transcriptional regulator
MRPISVTPHADCPPQEAFMTHQRRSDGLLDPVVQAARDELGGAGLPGDRIIVLRAIWRDLVTGFATQLGEHGMGFLQFTALYAVAGTGTLTIADLGEMLGRSPSAASRIATGLEQRGLLARTEEVADRRQRLLTLTPAGLALLALFDRARADQFLAVVRPLPMADRAVVAMAVGALATKAMTRSGRLIKAGSPG